MNVIVKVCCSLPGLPDKSPVAVKDVVSILNGNFKVIIK